VNSLPKTVTRQRCDCDLNPGPSAPESSMLPGVVFVTFQGCGLGLETVSRCNNVSSRSRLGPIRLGPRLGLGPKRLGVSSRSRAISCRWSRRFVRHTRSVAQYTRRRPIQTNLP